jgi:hypothetical protein
MESDGCSPPFCREQVWEYAGTASFDWTSPTLSSTHRFTLFLAQSDSVPNHDAAEDEVESFGFFEIALGERRKSMSRV